jgi:hypothetical protein
MELDAHAQDMEDMWSQVAEQLAFLVGSVNAVPLHLCHNSQQAVSRQLLFLTGPDSQLRSPSSSGCPVCLATASACIATCRSAFEGEMPLPSAASFCQSHHWILAASMVLHSHTDSRGRYHSWLKQQFEQRQAALIGAQSYGTAQHGQHCLACSSVAESSGQALASLIRDLGQARMARHDLEKRCSVFFTGSKPMRPVRANLRHASCKRGCFTGSKSSWPNWIAQWKPISHALTLPGESEARYPTSLKRRGPGSVCLPFSPGSQPWYSP